MEKRKRRTEISRNAIARTAGALVLAAFVASFIGGTAMLFNNPKLYYYTPQYHTSTPRDMKMGTYLYDHTRIAAHPEYFDDIALMVDRVLVDLMWTTMVKNASYPTCFDIPKYVFYDQFFQNLTSRGLEVVIQFSPTRSLPTWLNITSIERDDGRSRTPPRDPVERARFIQHCMYYVNYTVDYYASKPYAPMIEYCLSDEPYTADWSDVFAAMYAGIKARAPAATVSNVLNKPELYPAFLGSLDMLTIDPYNDDFEMAQKIRAAHEVAGNAKPVRVIVSGMHDDAFDYQRIYRQLVISWFMGAHDMWFWSYNSRWDGETNEWYVVLFSEDGPVHTERADAVLNARQDLEIFGQIDSYLKTGTDQALKDFISEKQLNAYSLIVRNNFSGARRELLEAKELLDESP
ncbi:MAG: hypothetical protein JW839_13925 [Candidatus Lokiarchaeota archaeon]|nr:hypothetical protein [Candidatus Lokiarchaeota archaeon]